MISRPTLLRALKGIAVATKPCDEDLDAAVQWISLHRIPQHESGDSHEHDHAAATFSFYAWRTAIASDPFIAVEDRRQLVNLALSVVFLREKCRLAQSTAVAAITPSELALVWGMICTAMTCPSVRRPSFSVSRSAQGFLAVPICSLVENGNIDELFRLHVWLPDGQRGIRILQFILTSLLPTAGCWRARVTTIHTMLRTLQIPRQPLMPSTRLLGVMERIWVNLTLQIKHTLKW